MALTNESSARLIFEREFTSLPGKIRKLIGHEGYLNLLLSCTFNQRNCLEDEYIFIFFSFVTYSLIIAILLSITVPLMATVSLLIAELLIQMHLQGKGTPH